MAPTRYVERLGRVFEALQVLDCYRRGITIEDLAHILGCLPQDVVADLRALNAGTDLGVPGVTVYVEFLAWLPDVPPLTDTTSESDELFVEPEVAKAVRLPREFRGMSAPHDSSGTVFGGGLSLSEVGAVLMAAEDLMRTEPGNDALSRVVAALRTTWLPGVTEVWRASHERMYEAELRRACQERRQTRIRYERVWEPGVITRVIEPYQLVRTHRGFEVDAGPIHDNGHIRTYLVNNIRELTVLDDIFCRPADVETLCAENRRTSTVHLVVPRDRTWAAEYLSEAVSVVQTDANDAELQVELMEPLADRAGLVVLQAGPGAFISQPPELAGASEDVARRLLAHHRLTTPHE